MPWHSSSTTKHYGVLELSENYLIWLSLWTNLFLWRVALSFGSCKTFRSNCCTSTRPSSGKTVSLHRRHILSLDHVINTLVTVPLQNITIQFYMGAIVYTRKTVVIVSQFGIAEVPPVHFSRISLSIYIARILR